MTLTKVKLIEFLRSRPVLHIFFVCLSGLSLIFALHTRGRIFRPEWGIYFLLWAIPAICFWIWKRKEPQEAVSEVQRGALVLIFFMMLSFFSSHVLHKWFYFLNWRPQVFPFESTMVIFVLASLLLSSLLLLKPGLRLTPWLALLLAGVQLWCFFCLHQRTGGEAIYRDDHPSFIFRLWEFARTFPHTSNYVPYWNAGVIDYVAVTSGIGAIGLPLLPIWKFMNIFDIYTYAFAFIYIFVMPLMAVFSLWLLGTGWAGSLCAGFLALGVSRHFFLWLLEYGTIGALFSSFFILPVSVLLYRVVHFDEINWKTAGMFIISVFFLFQWPPGIMLCACLGISFIFNFQQWTFRKCLFLTACAMAVFILDAKPILTIFTRGLETVSYVNASEGAFISFWEEFRQGLTYLFAHLQEGHPLLVFLGLGGLMVVPRSLRKWYVPVLICLALLTGWGPFWKPHLQLGRMSIPFFFLLIAPAAFLADHVLKMGRKKTAVFRATVIVLLVLGGWNVSRIYANQGLEHYVVLPREVKELTAWIYSHTAPDERILFAGATVHGYGGGHIAALPILTGREMMACDYYHFPRGTVEYNYPPKAFRSSPEKMGEFLRLYRVGCVITFRKNYKKFFREEMKEFLEEKITIGDKTIFRVKEIPASMFLRGEGRLKADFNRIQINLSPDTAEAVIRYHWDDALKSRLPVELFPYDAGEGIRFIGIRPNGVRNFEIVYDD